MNTSVSEMQFADRRFRWSEWSTRTSAREAWGPVVAVDTETTRIVDRATIPELCLASASDGHRSVVMKPSEVAAWIEEVVTPGTQLVFHNAAFDFWVLDRHLAVVLAAHARDLLWTAVDEGRVHDTMLLEMLISLARADDGKQRKLADLSETGLQAPLPKDLYPEEFGQLLDRPWEHVEPGFFEYAVRDAVATWLVYEKLEKEARDVVSRHGLPCAHGLLTEAIQVKGAISLARVTQLGMGIDRDRVRRLKQQWDARIKAYIEEMERLSVDQAGGSIVRRWTDRATGVERVSIRQKVLQGHLESVSRSHALTVPRAASGAISLSVKYAWRAHLGADPLLATWADYTSLKKQASFLEDLDQPRINPRYQPLVRTGRTSCRSPNIQQFPRSSPVREAITASPGFMLLIIDYTCLELRTLAAVCFDLFGFSQLRDVLIKGIDPHRYTAALFAGMTVEEFVRLPEKDQDERRQRAKAFNFGIPGGLGARTFVEHARVGYGVTVSPEDAELFISKLTGTVYPELGKYLREDPAEVLTSALGANAIQLNATWPKPSHLGALRKILAGNPVRADGTPYERLYVERVWMELRSLCGKPDLIPFIERRDVSAQSPLRALFSSHARTLTGRVRGPVSFTQARNTPFQGLAADGCKEVLWRLTKRGHRVVAFVHDEFVVEIPECDDYRSIAERIVRDCEEGMEPFVPGIPVECKYAVSQRWHKSASAVFDAGGRLVPWFPKEETKDDRGCGDESVSQSSPCTNETLQQEGSGHD